MLNSLVTNSAPPPVAIEDRMVAHGDGKTVLIDGVGVVAGLEVGVRPELDGLHGGGEGGNGGVLLAAGAVSPSLRCLHCRVSVVGLV